MRVDNANNTWKTLATAIATKATDAHKLKAVYGRMR